MKTLKQTDLKTINDNIPFLDEIQQHRHRKFSHFIASTLYPVVYDRHGFLKIQKFNRFSDWLSLSNDQFGQLDWHINNNQMLLQREQAINLKLHMQ